MFDKIRLSVKLFGLTEAVLAFCVIYGNFEDLPAYSQDFAFSRAKLNITENILIVDS